MSTPQGMLLMIGGSEDRGSEGSPSIADECDHFQKLEILQRFVEIAAEIRPGHVDPRIEIIPTASTIPEEIGAMYRNVFRELRRDRQGRADRRRKPACSCSRARQRISSGGSALSCRRRGECKEGRDCSARMIVSTHHSASAYHA